MLRALNEDLFQFIKWEDEEPYSIAELIEEYENEEYDYFNMKLSREYEQFINESEETEVKKDIEWLKIEIHKELESWHGVEGGIDGDGINEIMLLINQLDKPETLSPDWIKDNQVLYPGVHSVDYYVPAKKLFGLIVPKQEEPEKPVIPDFVAEWIEKCKKEKVNAFIAYNRARIWGVKAKQWIMSNPSLFSRAYLDGYTVEEKKYYVKEPITGQFLIKDDQQSNGVKWVDGFSSNPESYTEQEIKNIDERYWEFRKTVEEEEE